MRLNEFANPSYFISINSSLNPAIWNGNKLDPRVREKLLKIALVFEKFVGIDLKIVDVTLTGSNANFTWTKFSDLDLHLIVANDITDELRELFNAKKALWAEHHDITIKGLPVECYVQGAKDEHHSSGIYSVANSKWLVTPKKTKPSIDDSSVQRKLDAVVHDVTAAMSGHDEKRIAKIKERITNMRKSGLERAGEWSTENLVFKALRNMGIIDQLSQKIRDLEDRELSLEQIA
jgi:predicted nucleotidyltransferase